jgi:F-type H+-transporting ATPase subunit epsilon
MRRTLSVKIILPSMTMLDTEASMVNLPGEEGMFGVLPGHCNLISNIKTGIVSVFLGTQEQKYFVFAGLAQVTAAFELNIISEFASVLEQETKTNVMNHITSLESSLLDHQQLSLQTDIIQDKLKKYQELLKFL